MNLKFRLSLMNFLEFAVWGAYLTCMGNYLGVAGLGHCCRQVHPAAALTRTLPSACRWLYARLLVDGRTGRFRARTSQQGLVHRDVHNERGVLYAYHRAGQHYGVHDSEKEWARHGERFPAYSRAWNRWIYCYHVVCQLCCMGQWQLLVHTC